MAKVTNIKCPNCGANLDLEENKSIITCQYCNADLKVEKDLNDIFQARLVEGRKIAKRIIPFMFLPFIISFTLVICVSCSIAISLRNNGSSFDKTKFNSYFIHANGTQTGLFLNDTLDKAIDSNKKNNKQIYVKYEKIKTNDEDEIIEIKDSLEILDYYEVKIDYDKSGYVNLITINKK